jgi:hypothetical protein
MQTVISKTATGRSEVDGGLKWVEYLVVQWVWSPVDQRFRQHTEKCWYVE